MGARDEFAGSERPARSRTTDQDTPPEGPFSRSGQVSWLAGRHLLRPAFPAQVHQWTLGGKLAAYSCGGSLGIGVKPHRIPS
jgi:hypothetical protein